MTSTPHNDLLRKQRTFSIDETREQLSQGRPVQREAVMSAAPGDYTSMMFGERDGFAQVIKVSYCADIRDEMMKVTARPKTSSVESA